MRVRSFLNNFQKNVSDKTVCLIQTSFGYAVIAALIKPLTLVICHFVQFINSTFLTLILLTIFLYFYQICPLEESNYLLGFRIELRNQGLHWII